MTLSGFRLNKNNPAFTVLEVVVVIVVAAFFLALIVPGLINGPSRARDATRKSDLRIIKASLENYYNEKGSYPTKLTELEAGATPFIKKLPKDPKTGAEYVYTKQGGKIKSSDELTDIWKKANEKPTTPHKTQSQ